jgi:hypothetical protein
LPEESPSRRGQEAPAICLTDPESQRVLAAAAQALARELGRRVAEEYFDLVVRGVPPRWLTVEACAQYLTRTPRAIREMAGRRQIPHVMRDGRIYFDRFVIDQWMAEHPRAVLDKPTWRPKSPTGRVPRSAWRRGVRAVTQRQPKAPKDDPK